MVAIQQIKPHSFYLAGALNERQTECRHRSPLDRLRPTVRAGRALQLSLHAQTRRASVPPSAHHQRYAGAGPAAAGASWPAPHGTAQASKRPLACLRRARGYRTAATRSRDTPAPASRRHRQRLATVNAPRLRIKSRSAIPPRPCRAITVAKSVRFAHGLRWPGINSEVT